MKKDLEPLDSGSTTEDSIKWMHERWNRLESEMDRLRKKDKRSTRFSILLAFMCAFAVSAAMGSGAINVGGFFSGTATGPLASFDVIDAGTGMVAGQFELGADLIFQTQSGTGIHGFRTGENCAVFGPATGGNQWFFCGKPNVSLEISNNTSVYTSWRLSDGFLVPTAGVDSPVGKFNVVDAGQLNTEGNTNLSRAGGRTTYTGREVMTARPNDGGTPQVTILYDYNSCGSGTKAVTFVTAFSVAPACTTADDTALGDVVITTGPSTTGFTATCTGASDRFMWTCIGDR